MKKERMKCVALLAIVTTAIMVVTGSGCKTISGSIDITADVPEVTYISPANQDWVQDFLLFPLGVVPEAGIVVRGYAFRVFDETDQIVWSMEGSVPVPKSRLNRKKMAVGVETPTELVWDGRGYDDEFVPDGRYYYYIEAWDGYGNQGRTESRVVVVDNTAPTVKAGAAASIFSPNGDGRQDILTIEQRESSVEKLWEGRFLNAAGRIVRSYTWAGKASDLVWDGTGNDGAPALDGMYRYEVTCVDEAGNRFSQGIAGIHLDTRPSVVTVKASRSAFSPNGDGIADTITFSLTAATSEAIESWKIDVLSEAGQIEREISGRGVPPNSFIFDGKGDSGKTIADGPYFAEFIVEYVNGDFPRAVSDRFISDTQFPKIKKLQSDVPIFSPDGDGNKDFVTFEQDVEAEYVWIGSVYDAAGKKVLERSWQGQVPSFIWEGRNEEGSIVPDGEYWYELYSVDVGENRTSKRLGPVVVDSRPTPVTLTVDSFAFSPNGDGVSDTITFRPGYQVKEGIANWSISVFASGNMGTATRIINGTGTPSATVRFDGKDSKGVVLSDGRYSAVLTLEYEKGDKPRAASPSFTVDTVAPTVAVTAEYLLFSPDGDGRLDTLPLYQSGSAESSWKGEFSDSAGRVVYSQTWTGRPRDFAWNGMGATGTRVPDGTYTYTVSTTDLAGNRGSALISGIVSDTRNTQASVEADIAAISPNADGIMDTVSLALQANPTDGVDRWHLALTNKIGDAIKTYTGYGVPPRSITWNGIGENGKAVEDAYTAVLTVEYAKGNVAIGRSSKTVTVDLSPPKATMTVTPKPFSPDGDGVADLLTIRMGATDPSGVRAWELVIIDPADHEFRTYRGTGAPPATLEWNGRSPSGELVQSAEDYEVKLTVTDEVGNSGTISDSIPVDILVIRDGDNLKIVISSIYFKSFTADYRDEQAIGKDDVARNLKTLDRLAQELKKYAGYKIRLEGHAVRIYWYDQVLGTREETETLAPLSLDRAKAIKEALIERGIQSSRMTVSGFGGTRPVVPHSDLDNRWKNRRVEFILIK